MRIIQSTSSYAKRAVLLSVCLGVLLAVATTLAHAANEAATITAQAVVAADCSFSRVDVDAVDVLILQRARARIKSKNMTASRRSLCSENAAQSANGHQSCVTCQRELIGLFKDAAKVQRDIANTLSKDAGSKSAFIRREIRIRLILNEYLSGSLPAPDPTHADRRQNLVELADAYELAGLGMDLHKRALVESQYGVLDTRAYANWARAVRSCSSWNFDATNRYTRKQLAEALCNADCGEEYARLDTAVDRTHNEKVRVLVDSVVPQKLCATGATP